MTKVVSEEQRLANQQNAQKSTGPTTPEGKTKVARNALKHGLLAQAVVVTGPFANEDRAQFDALLDDLIHELKPRDLIQQTLVERIATCYWRLRRAHYFEAGSISTQLEANGPAGRAMNDLREELASALHNLRKNCRHQDLLNKPVDQLTPEESAEYDRTFNQSASLNSLLPIANDVELRKTRLRRNLPAIIEKQRSEVAALRSSLALAEREYQFECDRKKLVDAIPNRDALFTVVRYETMLDRQLHRALTELRRRQSDNPQPKPEPPASVKSDPEPRAPVKLESDQYRVRKEAGHCSGVPQLIRAQERSSANLTNPEPSIIPPIRPPTDPPPKKQFFQTKPFERATFF